LIPLLLDIALLAAVAIAHPPPAWWLRTQRLPFLKSAHAGTTQSATRGLLP
jgi:hypothetical protein